MLNTARFGELLDNMGFKFYSGVPCSFLKYLINYAINHHKYVAAANEGDAVAIAAGAYLGGEKSAVLMQNSGLTNALSPLTSLNYIFKIPVLGFVSLRGENGVKDEPQHELTGVTTDTMLKTAGVAFDFLSQDIKKATNQLEKANEYIDKNRSFFFIVRKNTFSEESLDTQTKSKKPEQILVKSDRDRLPMTRVSALKIISGFKSDDTLLLACTGKCGRELFELGDSAHNFYMVGSMGCIGSIGLGLSIIRPNKKFIAIDGDGALLMRMGSLATNAYYGKNNLLHILMDNNTYDSTGGQATLSDFTDFTTIAFACGYRKVIEIHTPEELKYRIKEWQENPSLTFLYIQIEKGSKKNLSRPTVKPNQVRERFMEFISRQSR